jgi:hypothetical protein
MCLQPSLEKARNMKLLLYMYEQMAGFKINFKKSEVVLIGGDNDLAVQYAEFFNCQIDIFPSGCFHSTWQITFGGLGKNGREVCQEDRRVARKFIIHCWKNNTNQLNSIIYHMSMYLVPKTVARR